MSSFSGRHLGHYKVLTQLAQKGDTNVAHTLVMLINIAILTSTPLPQWHHSAQVMEKGKGNYTENLHIIQLCKVDLAFALNALWGYQMIQKVQQQ